jgi:hypothetical protein
VCQLGEHTDDDEHGEGAHDYQGSDQVFPRDM